MNIQNTIPAWTAAFAPTLAKGKAPVRAVLRKDGKWPIRWAFLILFPALVGCMVYRTATASVDAPVESREGHPAPPSRLHLYGKSYDLTTLENPVRAKVLEQLKTDPAQASKTYAAAVRSGRDIYFKNCFHCHGDQLDGQGMFAAAQNPPPTNFRDVAHLAHREAYLFWRITTGGPGLPKEGAPWNSTMPAWHERLSEEEVWNVIIFLYDRVGQMPKMRDQEVAKAVTSMTDEIQAKRAEMDGKGLYQFHCAVCHGEQGAGDGPAAEFLYPAPRDFTIGMFKYKTSPAELPQPTDEDLFRTIKHGLPGTGMPAWGSVLDDDQIRNLIPAVKGFDTVGIWAPEDAPDEDFDGESGRYLKTDFIQVTELVPVKGQIPFTEESAAEGKRGFEKNCTSCHGDEGRGNPDAEKRLRDDWGKRIWPRDLSKPWTWRVTNEPESTGETVRKIFTRLSVGIPGTPMPEQASGVGEETRWHIANYVYTLRDNTLPPTGSPVIRGVKVEGSLPNSVNDGAWAAAPATTLLMLPNIIEGDRLFKPLNDALSVRLLYNDEELAFLLELDDRTYSRPGDPVAERIQDRTLKLYSDAFAIQFPKQDAFAVEPAVEKPLLPHGDRAHPTTIWYWNAGSVEPKTTPYGMILDAAGADEKLRPRPGDTSLTASGNWVNGRWRVMMKRRRDGGDASDVTFAEGVFIPVSFANWDGSNGEAGSKHTLTSWYWLLLPTPDDRL